MGIMPTTTRGRVSLTSDEKTMLSPPPLAPLSLSLSSSSSPVAHQNMRRAKSLSTFMSGAGVPDRPPMSAPPVVAQRTGKRQKGSTTPAALLAMKLKNSKAWTAVESKGNIAAAKTTMTSVVAAADDDEEDAFATSAALCSSSPITATLKRARVLFGSGKSIICPVPFPSSIHCPRLTRRCILFLHRVALALLFVFPLPPSTLFIFFLFNLN
jgi:hypothetical protein